MSLTLPGRRQPVAAGPPVGTVEVQPRPASPDGNTASPSPPSEAAKRSKVRRPQHPPWVLASKPRSFGPRRMLWFFYTLTRLYKYEWVPVPRACGLYGRREAENWVYIRSVSDKIMAIIATIGGKGGILKTTILTWLAAGWAKASTGFTVLVDADSNATTSAARRYEVDPKDTAATSRVADMILHRNWRPACEDLVRLLACHLESMVRVTFMPPKTAIGGEDFSRVLKELKPACHTLFVDTTPGRTETNTYGVIEAVTVPVLTGKLNSDDDLYAIGTTLDYEDYGLRRRMAGGDAVLIAIGAVSWRDFNLRTVYRLAEKFQVSPESIVLFPEDKYILKTGPVRHSRVPTKYHYANSVLARRCAVAAISYNEAHPRQPLPGEATSLGQPAGGTELSAGTVLQEGSAA